MGDYSLALPLYQQALEIRGRVLGNYILIMLLVLIALLVYFEIWEIIPQRYPFIKKSMEIRRNVLGNHPDFAISPY